MLRRLRHRDVKKGRVYPIKRDERGRSARSRAFRAFDRGKMSAEVAALVDISRRTAYRYRAAWKKLPSNHELGYRYAKWALSKESGLRGDVVSMIADARGMSQEEVVRLLEKPNGLKQLIMGKWPNPKEDRVRSQQEARMSLALTFVHFLEHTEMPDDEVMSWVREGREALQRAKEGGSRPLRSAPGGQEPERGAGNAQKGRGE